MRYIRARASVAVDYMRDYLLPDDDFSEGMLAEALRDMMQNTPDGIYVGQAWEGDELKAFVIAFAPPNMGHVFIHQAWANPEINGTKVQDKLFLRLCLWAETIERSELRAETKRNPEALLRRWNFKPFSQILSFDIGEGLTDRLTEVSHNVVIGKEEKSNGVDVAADEGESGAVREADSERVSDNGVCAGDGQGTDGGESSQLSSDTSGS